MSLDADSFLTAPVGESSSMLRKQGHLAAKIHMRACEYEKAIAQIETTLAAYGSHVGLWADLYTCYYCQGKKRQAFSALENLKREFASAQALLSPESRLKTQLVLAKGFEDAGEVAWALDLLRLEPTADVQGIRLMILANLLRLKSLLGERSDLGKLYVLLTQKAFDPGISRYDQIEIQHALMLADCELIGPKNTCARAEELLKHSDLDRHDRALVFYDLIEALRLCGVSPELEGPAPQTEFERVLKKFSLSPEQESKLSLSELLRLTTCFLANARDASEAVEWLKKFDMLLSALSPESQELWRSRLQRKRQLTILVDVSNGGIQAGKLKLEMKVKSQAFQLLCELARNPKVCLEQLALDQGEREFSEVFQNRVRIAIHRLNQQLDLGLQIAQVSKTHLSLSEMVTIILT